MLMRHMHMGIIMNIAVRFCFICAFSLPQEITQRIPCLFLFVNPIACTAVVFYTCVRQKTHPPL